jgi:hypothetical protein
MKAHGRWFAAAFLLEAHHPDGAESREPLYEKRVIIFDAKDESDAERKAAAYCGKEPESYRNQ